MKKLCLVVALVLLTCGAWAPAVTAASWADPAQGPQLRTLQGVVLRNNQPVAEAITYLKNTRTLAVKTYITGKDGSFRFSSLSPDVDYEVYAEKDGKRSDTKTLSSFDSRKVANFTLHIK